MSNTPVCVSAASITERRQHVRGRVSAVAYLEIGTDNGGIALNLSEEGMAFQAVGPLDSETSVNLRIQLPDSLTRVKTTAQVIWLKDSNRQAGVRFVDLPLEGKTQIREWISSQIPPIALSDGVPPSQAAVSQPPTKEGGFRESRKDKWLTMVKLKEQESVGQPPELLANDPGRIVHQPADQGDAPMFPAQASASGKVGLRTVPPSEALWRKQLATRDAHYQPGPEPIASGSDSQINGQGSTSISTPSPHRADDRTGDIGHFGLSRPDITTVRSTTAELSTPAVKSAGPSGLESMANVASVLTRTISSSPEPPKRKRMSARKWVGIGVFSAVFAILCFGIGTWVGSRGNGVQSVQISTSPDFAAPVAKPATSGSNVPKASGLASAIVNKAHAEPVKNSGLLKEQKLNLTFPTTSRLASPVQRDDQSVPAAQSPVPLPATTNPDSSSALAPVSDDSAAMVPAPRIVNGRTLRPTDRFNNSYLTYRVEPAYPLEARQQQIEGTVKMHVVIGADGKVGSVHLLSGSPLLAPAAMDAAKFWQYLPALLNGQPVESEEDIEIHFQLPH